MCSLWAHASAPHKRIIKSVHCQSVRSQGANLLTVDSPCARESSMLPRKHVQRWRIKAPAVCAQEFASLAQEHVDRRIIVFRWRKSVPMPARKSCPRRRRSALTPVARKCFCFARKAQKCTWSAHRCVYCRRTRVFLPSAQSGVCWRTKKALLATSVSTVVLNGAQLWLLSVHKRVPSWRTSATTVGAHKRSSLAHKSVPCWRISVLAVGA